MGILSLVCWNTSLRVRVHKRVKNTLENGWKAAPGKRLHCFVCGHVVKSISLLSGKLLLSTVPWSLESRWAWSSAHLHRALEAVHCSFLCISLHSISARPGSLSCLNAAFPVGTKPNQSWLYKAIDWQHQLTMQLPHPCWGPVRNSAKAQQDLSPPHLLLRPAALQLW